MISFFCIISCTNSKSQLSWALEESGENRQELETVLDYYKSEPEKLLAAKFLIENMPAHYSYEGEDIYKYYAIAQQVLASKLSPVEQRDSLLHVCDNHYPGLEEHTISDVKVITSEFLIHNIDCAFTEWKTRPWASHLTFDEFCEWLLPYKAVDLQELDSWRDTLSTFFTWGLNNMVHDDDQYETPYNAANTVRNEINWRIKPYGVYNRKGYSLLSAATLPHQTFGNCADYVRLAVLTYRSVGIPAIIDETPYWGRYRAGHSWYTILNDRGEQLTSEWDISSMPGTAFFTDKRIPKVYRNTYSINQDRLKYLKKSSYKYPFKVCQQDITDQYFNTSNIVIPMFSNKHIAEKYVYIATFTGMDTDWSIVDFGYHKRGKAYFSKMGRNVMYIALGFNGKELIPISKPFVLHKDGSIEYITCDTTHLRSVEVRRKYYQSNSVLKMRKRTLGAQIQCSDNPDFSNAVTLYTITGYNIPDKIPIIPDKPYRYWRYQSPNGSYGSIAELAFFDSDSIMLQGTPISNTTDLNVISRAFDNDWLSNFETGQGDGNWIGMDMSKPTAVSYVRIVPRGDDNDIHPGDMYVFRYWNENNEWTSLGIQTATDNSFRYDSIPMGTLMWLRNYTRGMDERPFLITENDSVIWW